MVGQAKQRGTKEQRVAQAHAKLAALRPETLVCGSCKTAFAEFEALGTRGLAGIDAAFGGPCPTCGESVVAFKDDAAGKAGISTLAELEGCNSVSKASVEIA